MIPARFDNRYDPGPGGDEHLQDIAWDLRNEDREHERDGGPRQDWLERLFEEEPGYVFRMRGRRG